MAMSRFVSRIGRSSWRAPALAAVALTACLLAPQGAKALDELTIIAPAAPGGGWDQTARSLQEVFQSTGAAKTIQVQNVPGAGGTIGLSQFVNNEKGQADTLLVSGLVMLGAILTNQSAVTLEQVTPIARLTGEYEVIVVPAASPFKTMADLVTALKADAGAVSWAGGSAGGTDHILVGLVALAVGVDPKTVNYVPFSGGGEALASLHGNHVAAGVSGYGEIEGHIEAGALRVVAISSAERIPGIDAPTLKEQGIDVELANWRAVMAPPDISPEGRQALLDALGTVVKSDAWQSILKKNNWMDLYMPGDEFATYLDGERKKVETTLKSIGLVE
jgi:putative tricarboxylic transport membrane protein